MTAAASPRGTTHAVCAIVVNHRRAELTLESAVSLESALDRLGEPSELIIVDNGSGDGSTDVIARRCPGARMIALPVNLGFAGAVDAALEESESEWVLLLNNDATLDSDAVVELLECARSGGPDVGSVAAQMRFAATPDIVNSAGIGVDNLGVAFDRFLSRAAAEVPSEPFEVFGASGGGALYRRRMLDELGRFDASFFFALEDVDLAWRARMASWRALCAPAALVWHHHGETGVHSSPFKHYHVGLNRIRLLAKNAEAAHLRRYGIAIAGYELAYVALAVTADRTLSPIRGRLRGLSEWRRYRRAGAKGRGPVALEPVRGVRAALRRRSAWLHAGSDVGQG